MKDCHCCPIGMPERRLEGPRTGFQLLFFAVSVAGLLFACNSVELSGDVDDLERDAGDQAGEDMEAVSDEVNIDMIPDEPVEEGFPEDLVDTSDDGEAEEECIPSCEGKDCGSDGCGGSCGECPESSGCDIWGQCHACGEMVLIPAGDFVMGTPDADVEAGNNTPEHLVTLSAFWFDVCEVTNAEWKECVDAGGCLPPEGSFSITRYEYFGNPTYDDYPVIWVSWPKADEYCRWAGKRLPTEAEWEKAARGGCEFFGDPVSCDDPEDRRIFPWGSEGTSCEYANYIPVAGLSCVGDTDTTGLRPAGASPYGILDMAGNVREFVSDWFGYMDYFTSSGPPWIDPQGPSEGFLKVEKGSCFFDVYADRALWLTRRGGALESSWCSGFRCGKDL